jgi:hypothetical protein
LETCTSSYALANEPFGNWVHNTRLLLVYAIAA